MSQEAASRESNLSESLLGPPTSTSSEARTVRVATAEGSSPLRLLVGGARQLLSRTKTPNNSASPVCKLELTFEEVAPDEADDCPICLAPLAGECATTRCGHRFHTACLEHNVVVSKHTTCPLCRSGLKPKQAVEAVALSGRRIEVMDRLPSYGDSCHFDREYKFLLLGDFASNPRMMYVKTSNDDKRTPVGHVMWKLETTVPTKVYLNFRGQRHVTNTGADAWLQAGGWEPSNMRSAVSSGIPKWLYWGPVYSKSFDAGMIELMGSNCQEGTYFVFVEVVEGPRGEEVK